MFSDLLDPRKALAAADRLYASCPHYRMDGLWLHPDNLMKTEAGRTKRPILTGRQLRDIKRLYGWLESYRKVAEKTGLSYEHVGDVIRGRYD